MLVFSVFLTGLKKIPPEVVRRDDFIVSYDVSLLSANNAIISSEGRDIMMMPMMLESTIHVQRVFSRQR